MNKKRPILIGSAYPLSLVRRKATIEPFPLDSLRELMQKNPVMSFWGHRNTLAVANTLLGVDLRPSPERPAILLTPDALPLFNGVVFRECYILSPDYRPGFRPPIGGEVDPRQIANWRALKIAWS